VDVTARWYSCALRGLRGLGAPALEACGLGLNAGELERLHPGRVESTIDARNRARVAPTLYNGRMAFTRITVNPDQMGGVPCLRGLRIPVATIVALVAEGQAVSAILADYPDLEAADVREALLFAAEAVRERALPLAAGE
jgi:uncharacterized protein (DUF433 family)